MAVTGETAKFKLPYFKPGDSPPDMAAVTKAISERVEAVLAKGGDVSIAADGTITIAQKDGEPATPSMRTLGTGAKQAAAGNDSRLSDERVPKANSVNSSKIEDGSVADTDLTSPNNASYRELLRAEQYIPPKLVGGVNQYIMSNNFGKVGTGFAFPVISAEAFASAEEVFGALQFFYFDDADYAVSGKTLKMRVRSQFASNATAMGKNITVGLYPLTVNGAGKIIVFTLGTVVSGSTVTLEAPAASTVTQKDSGDFTIPTDGAYAFGFKLSGTAAENNTGILSAQLQLHAA